MARPRLHVLSWDRPLLPQAVDFLVADWNSTTPLDLSAQLIVVPTRQTGRRLREALAARAARSGQAVFPPRVVTPDALLTDVTPSTGVATRIEATLAWIEVLRSIKLSDFDEVFPVAPPARNFAWAARLAREFFHLQQTLAENNLRMADVPARGTRPDGGFPEIARWIQLAALEARYDAALAKRGRRDPEAARVAAVANAVPSTDTQRVVALATPDPQAAVIALLESFARTIPVEVVVFGPVARVADHGSQPHRGQHKDSPSLFDDWGRPHTETWNARTWSPPDFETRVHLCADPAAQAERIATAAATGDATAGWIAIGIADSEVIAPLHNGLRRAGLTSYDPEGRLRRAEPLFELLRLLLALARGATFDTITALARCPDVLAWLRATIGTSFSPARLLIGLDELQSRHLPASLNTARDHAPALAREHPELDPALEQLAMLQDQLAPRFFPENVRGALATIFGAREFAFERPADARAVDAATAWMDALRETAEAAQLFPGLAALDAWELALEAFGDSRRFDDKPADAVELQGWLELLWEDAPHLLIAGLNDGRVPTAVVGDPFLPESLRERLGLKTNAARLARDAYLLEAITTSRLASGRVDALVGRTSAAGDPLRPSRLLLRCSDAELPARVRVLFRDAASEHRAVPWQRAWPLTPLPAPPLTRLSVTAFRDYLACPFRFQLKHARRMEPVDPFKAELDARDFGNLCHTALEAMGRDATMRACADPAVLREFLLARLEHDARARYGRELSLPLLVQIESARQRLAKAAEVQAVQRADGWVITRVESKFEFVLHGLTVVGKIDRIDRHETTGAVRVLDYKTSDKPVNPRQAHVRKPKRDENLDDLPAFARFTIGGEELIWLDLQLPLYRRALAAEFGADITCGYFNLPKASTETAVAFWEDYDATWQTAAESCADGIATAVAAGRFWPPAELDEREDDFASIFHHGTAASVSTPSP